MDEECDRYHKQNVGASNLGVHGGNFRFNTTISQLIDCVG